MKKTLIAIAALAATGAFAQSTVTISGQVDVGVVNPIGTAKTRIDQAGNGFNQIVFAGSEDLGGGLKANFRLAQRFSPESGLNDGTNGNRPAFQGETTVGLSGAFGSVKLGRALTAFQGPINATDPWGTGQVASVATLTGSFVTAQTTSTLGSAQTDGTTATSGSGLARTDGIFYTSPNLGGFTAAVTLGLKDTQQFGATATGAKNFYSTWLSYNAGPLTVAGGAEQNRVGDKISALQASYNAGVVVVGATVSKVDFLTGTDSKGYNVSAIVPMGAITVKAGYGQHKPDNAAATTKKLGLGLDYALSKRTLVYTSVANDRAVAASKTGFDVGVRHAF